MNTTDKDLTDAESQSLTDAEGFVVNEDDSPPVLTAGKKRGRKKKAAVSEEQPEEIVSGDLADSETMESQSDEEDEGDEPEAEPLMSSPEWSDFVQRQFTDDEVDAEGHPFVFGLRRVANLLLGPTLDSNAHVVQPPRFLDGAGLKMQPTCVEYTVRLLMTRLEHGLTTPYPASFTDTAEVYVGNTDAEFARYPSAMAATRAEGRALRKALMLRHIVSSEEKTLVPLSEAGLSGMITPQQINFIDILCRRCKVDVMAYINMGKTKYDKIEEVSYEAAQKMTEHLSGWQNDPSKIPDKVKPYKIDWRNQE